MELGDETERPLSHWKPERNAMCPQCQHGPMSITSDCEEAPVNKGEETRRVPVSRVCCRTSSLWSISGGGRGMCVMESLFLDRRPKPSSRVLLSTC
ncbi:hypothetical protein EYF80_067591 [Liparis tanakae]|uniref:Uncharacterized protein n=1 Tax=Liparis tanakae TaxID=230148 RepID=A0A4Z2E0K0_9TELE|nr:hypothetical protein EYF80_067591 [Liparis tanakae]